MTARRLEGRPAARALEAQVAREVTDLMASGGPRPGLVVVLVGDDAASGVYVRNKQKACERVGVDGHVLRLPSDASESSLLDELSRLNDDPAVHGILVQLPLPAAIRHDRVLDAVHPTKDVDGFHPENVGRLVQGRPRFVPCTPLGIVQLLYHHGVTLAGRHVVVVGRSDIVGKPFAALVMQRSSPLGPEMANATVTVCHSRTASLADITRTADVLVVATGQPRLITAAMVGSGTAVVDVGIHRTADGLVGDVDFESVREVAGWLSPVPGGVGPLTIACLLCNTLAAARWQATGVLPGNGESDAAQPQCGRR